MADKWGGLAQGISRGIHDYATLERMKNEKARYDSMAAMDKERMGLEREKVGLLKDQSQRSAAEYAYMNDKITTAGQYLKGQGLTDEDIQTAVSIFPGVNADTPMSRKDLGVMEAWLNKNPQAKMQFGRTVINSLENQLGTLDPKSDEYKTLKQQIDAQRVQIFGKPEKAEKPSNLQEEIAALKKAGYTEQEANKIAVLGLQEPKGAGAGGENLGGKEPELTANIKDRVEEQVQKIAKQHAEALKDKYNEDNNVPLYKQFTIPDKKVFGMSETEWIAREARRVREELLGPNLQNKKPEAATQEEKRANPEAKKNAPIDDVLRAVIENAKKRAPKPSGSTRGF